MNAPKPEAQAEALYGFIRGQTSLQDPEMPASEASLASALQASARQIEADPAFQADLEERLVRKIKSTRPRRPTWLSHYGRGLVWIGLSISLVFSLAWAIRNLLPRPVKPLGQPVVQTSPTATLQSAPQTPSTGLVLPASTPTAELPPPVLDSAAFPGISLVLQAGFPVSTTQVQVFSQQSSPPLTAENAQAVAAQLGIQGPVYSAPTQFPDQNIYFVSDGASRVLFLNSPQVYHYTADMLHAQPDSLDFPPVADQVAAAEAFLKAHDLLNFAYQVETPAKLPGVVRFIPLLESHAVRYSMLSAPWIEVQTGAQGQVLSVDSNLSAFQPLGSYPIISAEQAWQKVISKQAQSGIESSSESVSPYNMRSWQHEYPSGQQVELFGSLEVSQPVVPGSPPFVVLNNYPVDNPPADLLQSASAGQFVQVWGQFQPGANGKPVFHAEGWQASTFTDQTLEGAILRRGDRAVLATADRTLLLPDLPANVPDSTQATVRGVVVEQPEPTLEWSEIYTGASGGGGGGGGSSFPELNLNPASGTPLPPTPAPEPGVQTGQRLDGVQGVVFVTIFQSAEGSTRDEVTFTPDASSGFAPGLTLRLEGPALSGVQAYHRLPIRVWGAISGIDAANPTLQIDRYEPVYPGLASQAWLGACESVTLQGQQVLRFTVQAGAQGGTQYILESSIKQSPESMGVIPGVPVIVEGAAYPDKTFASLPVITDFVDIPSPGVDTLDGYQPQTLAPAVIQDAPSRSSQRRYTIDKVELVYLTDDLRNGPPASSSSYAQPVWRFSGLDEAGDPFEILVQALKPEFLK